MNEIQNATKHYKYYPDEEGVPPYLAYGFRSIFLLLAPYIVISIVLWSLYFSGVIKLVPLDDMLSWHIYEMVFGVGVAGVMAFLFTGLPELFPGTVPIIGKRLKLIMLLWIAGRVSFWTMDYTSVFLTAVLNIAMWLVVIAWAFKPVVLDRLQRHSSLAYTLVALTLLQTIFFASVMGVASLDPLALLKVGIGLFMVLLLLALRRVNMEAINERLEHERLDDAFVAKPFRYNVAVFSVLLFTTLEYLYPAMHSTIGWVGLAAAASILGVLNDYNLKFVSLLNEPFAYHMALVPIMMSLGYGFMGYSYLFGTGGLSNYLHFLTTGAFGLSFFVVMVIVTYVHTGRVLKSNWWIQLGVLMIVASTLIRSLIAHIDMDYMTLIWISTLLWATPFVIYFLQVRTYLLSPRADGIKG